MNENLRRSLRLPEETSAALERAAANDRRSVSSLILKILTDWVCQYGFLSSSAS